MSNEATITELSEAQVAGDVCDSAIGGGLSEQEMAAWGGFLRAHARLVRELDAELAEQHGLPLSSYEVLVQLNHAEENRMRMSDLAEAVLLSRSGLTRLVDRLEQARMVERVSCESDQRAAWCVLTGEGHRRLAEARETHRDGVRRRFLERLSEDDQRQLAAAWERLLD